MKKALIIATGFVLFTLTAEAQNSQNETTQKQSVSTYTKGYYAIGDNAKKLPKPIVIGTKGQTVSKAANLGVNKGYYSMKGNNKQAASVTRIYIGSGQPVYQKGYYAAQANNQQVEKQ